MVGNPKGKITLVEFFDYNCGYCKRALCDLVTLMKAEPELRVVLKDFPVLGPNSVEAALVASAARKQISGDKFFEFHQKLLMGHGPTGREQALAVAKEMGLDMDKLQKDSKDPVHSRRHRGSHESGRFARPDRHARPMSSATRRWSARSAWRN